MRSIIMLDVDGVLNPCPFDAKRSCDWLFDRHMTSAGFAVNLSGDMAKALMSIDCPTEWLTTWGNEANEDIGHRIGIPPLPFTAEMDLGSLQWKRRHVAKAALSGMRVLWIDDDAEPFAWFRNIECIRPDPKVGLTRQHIEIARKWARL